MEEAPTQAAAVPIEDEALRWLLARWLFISAQEIPLFMKITVPVSPLFCRILVTSFQKYPSHASRSSAARFYIPPEM